ncbi:hypothetical protein V6N11_033948 [Hibiscus sabdariffa]|uniref:Secreted protein n=1 Tax=Hibiscus sabdariffa TaxID=183260 RepID=A0ABR2S0Y2_9ROSI
MVMYRFLSPPSFRLIAMGLYTSLAGALELEYNIDYNLRSLNKSNFIRTELLSAETCTPRDYSNPIASLIEFPSLPRPRISADVFSAHFLGLFIRSCFSTTSFLKVLLPLSSAKVDQFSADYLKSQINLQQYLFIIKYAIFT